MAQGTLKSIWEKKSLVIAILALAAIATHLLLRFAFKQPVEISDWPLIAALILGGVPLVIDLGRQAWRREFGSDMLAGISIVTSAILGEYLAGAIVVLMLSGGESLESFAVTNASSVLRALAKRMPQVAHRKADGGLTDIPTDDVAVGDSLVVFPHEVCPVDGLVIEGYGRMDESFLTGEPFQISKAPGAAVISGAVNGESAIVIRATQKAVNSRYAKIMQVMKESEQRRPKIRRMGDKLGAFYTPFALSIAIVAWLVSGDATRFLAVLVVATPCPLLLAIPISVIGTISLCARRGIVVRDPVALEQVNECRTIMFDKTGTLTYGEPQLTEQLMAPGWDAKEVLGLAAGLEVYSRHPLARALLDEAKREGIPMTMAKEVSEPPGQGLRGVVGDKRVQVTSRGKLIRQGTPGAKHLPPQGAGLECVIVVDDKYAATYRFRDTPRADGLSFIKHLGPKHEVSRVMIISGDRESEVKYLAEQVGISEVHAEQKPEEKLEIVQRETAKSKTMYVGDGINDAPAMMAATVGVAVGQSSDVTAEAAGVIVLDGELRRIDEFMHISQRMKTIALQSAIGGMILSAGGMGFAAFGMLTPVAGAIMQEVIDVLAIFNAIRAALPPRQITDFAER